MSENLQPCPECASELSYELGALLACPMCGHEWSASEQLSEEGDSERVIMDAVGNVLSDGDTVTIVKDMKVKGSSQPLKVGTRVRNIRLIDGFDGHDIDCKIDGFGAMQLKSSIVKKV
ncbi:MAG: zinc ribbon domain-containing protein YjdM [Microbacteriaceae bacterium]